MVPFAQTILVIALFIFAFPEETYLRYGYEHEVVQVITHFEYQINVYKDNSICKTWVAIDFVYQGQTHTLPSFTICLKNPDTSSYEVQSGTNSKEQSSINTSMKDFSFKSSMENLNTTCPKLKIYPTESSDGVLSTNTFSKINNTCTKFQEKKNHTLSKGKESTIFTNYLTIKVPLNHTEGKEHKREMKLVDFRLDYDFPKHLGDFQLPLEYQFRKKHFLPTKYVAKEETCIISFILLLNITFG